MTLAKKASAFFRRIRRHKNERRSTRNATLEEVELRSSGKSTCSNPLTVEKLKSRSVSSKEGAVAEAIQHKHAMTLGAFTIHEDQSLKFHRCGNEDAMDNDQSLHLVDDDDDDNEDEDDEEEGEREGGEDITSDEYDESEDEVDESVLEDMRRLEESFKGISQKYRLINRIGEGTFSTVYKAKQLPPGDGRTTGATLTQHDLEDDLENPPSKRRKCIISSLISLPTKRRRKGQLVALKKIYVTSSPQRIANELELLHILRDSPHICPLLTAFRHMDQVVAVLPYFRHLDFRLYYREFIINDMRDYFKSLISALHSVHKAGIIHRDIKPTNFLYDHTKCRGVLVDFGLAEKQGTDWQPCLCIENRDKRRDRFISSFAVDQLQANPTGISIGYPKNDPRQSRRANRAGTRGFRAPEVLLKCTSQTTKIDMWSAGVILLTLLARRFPFFNSADDVDAIIEMSSIFGKRKMKNVAAIHGSVFETNIETIGERGYTLEKIVVWASCREKDGPLRKGERQAVDFLGGLLELDVGKRWSAKEALNHDFFTAPVEEESERLEREQAENAEMTEAEVLEDQARRRLARGVV